MVADEYVGAVMSDLSSRRGRVVGTEPIGAGRTLVSAEVPQLEITRYAIDLRSLSHGTGTFTRSYSRHEAMPAHLVAKVTAENADYPIESHTCSTRRLRSPDFDVRELCPCDAPPQLPTVWDVLAGRVNPGPDAIRALASVDPQGPGRRNPGGGRERVGGAGLLAGSPEAVRPARHDRSRSRW